MKRGIMYLTLFIALLCSAQAFGNDLEERIRALEETVDAQGQTIKEQQETIDKLQLPKESGEQAMEKKDEETKPWSPFAGLLGAP